MNKLCWMAGALAVIASTSFSQTAPVWWTTRGVLSGQADDYAAANIGQLKFVANLATVEMDLRLNPSGAGTTIHQMVDPWWQPTASSRDDFSAVNAGQLKAVAQPFYDRLGLAYPWAGTSDDYALINLGQLKYAFKFAIPSANDANANGLLDEWESAYNASGALTASGDPDNDSLSNRAESLIGSDPTSGAVSDAAAIAALRLVVHSP
jgi:hypothetical protein